MCRIHKMRSESEAPSSVWNSLYDLRRTPWRSGGLTATTRRLLSSYAAGRRLLEVGCGTGDDSEVIVDMGFDYLGVDFAEAAIRKRKRGNGAEFMSRDFFKWSCGESFDVIYEKGFFHGLAGVRRRNNFIRRTASLLNPAGIWISICGSADHRRKDFPHGTIFLRDLVEPAEVYFEILEIVKDDYGLADRANEFQAWHAVFRRR